MVLTIVLMVVTSTSRMIQASGCDDDGKEDGVYNGVDGGDMHPKHLTQAVGCCLKATSKHNAVGDDETADGIDHSIDG
eukprot:12950163-Ditylum_brightwellii.AAC.1